MCVTQIAVKLQRDPKRSSQPQLTVKPFACWWLQELSWNLKGRREELSPAGYASPQKVTALFCTQTLNREVVTVIFLLSFMSS